MDYTFFYFLKLIDVKTYFMKQTCIVLFFMCLAIFPVNGNNKDTLCRYRKNEKMLLHIPQKVYLAGSEMRYHVTLFNIKGAPPGFYSKIVYMSLINSKGHCVGSWHTRVNNKRASGHIVLSDTLTSGAYTLFAYTGYMRNYEHTGIPFHQIYISGIRERIKKEASLPVDYLKNIIINNKAKQNVSLPQVVIQPENKTVGIRQKTRVTLSLKNASPTDTAILSVSVAAKPEAGLDSLLSPGEQTQPRRIKTGIKNGQEAWNPFENKGYVLSGKLKDKQSGNPVPHTNIILAVKDTTVALDYSKTDSLGVFYFLLDQHYDNQILVFHLPDTNRNKNNTSLLVDDKCLPQLNSQIVSHYLPDSAKNYLKQQRKIGIINQIYQNRKPPPLNHNLSNGYNKLKFAPKHNYKVHLAEYIALPNFRSIAENILPSVKYQKKNGACYLRIYDPETGMSWNNNALILLNGIPFNDYAYLDALGSKDIESIAVTKSCIFYGGLTFYGIISIVTYSKKIPKQYLKKQFTYHHPAYSSTTKGIISLTGQQVQDNSIPLFTPLLYFNSNVRICENEKVVLEFYTSDLKTTYTIKAKGILNGNNILTTKNTLTIE
jgi:hypothetical protein